MPVPLNALINILKESSRIPEQFLYSFSCAADKDIEYFLHNRAIEFEKLSKSRTYLICDEEQLKNSSSDKIIIYGYISLSLKNLIIPNQISNRMRKSLDGFSAKLHGNPIRNIPCYLIGQLSRNSNIPKTDLSGTELLRFSFDIIAKSVEAVGGRYIMIECRAEEKLIHFYMQNFFKEITRIPDGNVPMVQMIRRIY